MFGIRLLVRLLLHSPFNCWLVQRDSGCLSMMVVHPVAGQTVA